MKKIIAILLMISMLLTLCACGDKGANPDTDAGTTTEAAADPALGVYNGVSSRMFGSVSDMSEVYPGTNSVELKKNGKCVVTLDDDAIDGKYTLDGEAIDIVLEGESSLGTLKDGILVFDFMGLGMELIFAKEGVEVPADFLSTANKQSDDPYEVLGETSVVKYLRCELMKDSNDQDAAALYFDFANNGTEADSFGWSFYYILKQNGQELESTTILREDYSYLSETEYEDVNPGESMEVCITYALADTTSPIVITFTDLFDNVLKEMTIDLSEAEMVSTAGDSAAGYYTIYSFEQDGELIDLETLQMIGMDRGMYVIFNEDGTGRLRWGEEEYETELTYDADTIYNIEGDMSYYLEGEFLTVLTGDLIFTYQKSDEEPPAPGAAPVAGMVSDSTPFPAEMVEEFAGDWHGMAVIHDATGNYEHLLDLEFEIIARFVFDEEGYCMPYIAAALTEDSESNFVITSTTYNELAENMMLSGTFIGEDLEDYSNAYTYYDTLYIDTYIDDGAGNYLNLYACLKPLDAAWDQEVDYPALPAGAVEFYKGMSFEEIVELFGLDPADLPVLY